MIVLALDPYQITAIAIVVAVFLLILTIVTVKLYKITRSDPLIGHEAEVVAWKERDKRVKVMGEIWKAVSAENGAELSAGDIVYVIKRRDDLHLTVSKSKPNETEG